MRNAESSGIYEEQWGCQPNWTATETAFKKLLTLDYSRMKCKTFDMFANYATACFDCMVHELSTLISRKFVLAGSIMELLIQQR